MLCASAIAASSADARTTAPKTKRGWPHQPKVSSPVKVYRGIYIAPADYKPRAWARKWAHSSKRGMRRVKAPEIWAHARQDGALSYASGQMTRSLAPSGTGKLKQAVVLER